MTITDRRGITVDEGTPAAASSEPHAGLAIKTPVVAGTTANITLSGEQTIDGRAVVSGDRVLVKDQTNTIDNGIWVCSTGPWTRAEDFDGAREVITGTAVNIIYGTTNATKQYQVTSSGEILPGTTPIVFDGGSFQLADDTLTALAALNSTPGILTQTAADTFTKRTLQAPAAGITITNPAGTAGDPTLALANDLAALEAMSGTGIVARTASETYAQRTLTGTANEIAVTNGDGVSGNPTFSLSASITLTGKTITGGTFASPTAITGLPDPSSAQDAATKAYVDSVAAGLDIKPSVICATTANITLSGEQTLDGILTSASRVLVKNQSTASQNGIYVSAAGAWSRATDMDTWTEVPGAFVFVERGTLYADCAFVCTADAGGTIGSTSITWTQFAGAGTYTAGAGLSLTGTQFAISDAELLALAGLTSAADSLPYFTGSGTAALMTLNATARARIGDLGGITYASGDIFYYSGSALAKLAKGSDGQILTLASGLPSWASSGGLETLATNRTYYVRTDGSDSNTGLTNSSGGAFLTVQKAVDVIAATLNIAGYTVTIQIADGTYTGAVSLKNVAGFLAAGNLIIQGNNGTPANVIISTTSANCFTSDYISSVWRILDLEMRTTTSGACLSAGASTIQFGNVRFGACAGSHIFLSNRASIIATSNYAVSGGALAHINSLGLSFCDVSSRTITFSNSPTITTFVITNYGSVTWIFSNTFTNGGTVTATRYSVNSNGIIFTNGGGAAYLPGGSAGSAATQGQYL